MKLISNFRDYYDSVARQDREKEPVWIRNRWATMCSSIEQVEELEYKPVLAIDNEMVPPKGSVIGFAGRLYPVRVVPRQERWQNGSYQVVSPTTVVYDQDILCREWNGWTEKWNRDEEMCVYLEKIKQPEFVLSLFDRFGGQFVLRRIRKIYYGVDPNRVVGMWNVPILDQWGFVKILPPHLAWQEICMWRSNQAEKGRPIPELSNEDKITAAGFVKQSFRKRKSP